MAHIRELADSIENTVPRLLGTINTLLSRVRKPEGPPGIEDAFVCRTRLEVLELYPYRKRPYTFRLGEPRWREPYAALDIFWDDRLIRWLTLDVQQEILRLAESYGTDVPVCWESQESPEVVLQRFKAWCLRRDVMEIVGGEIDAPTRHSADFHSVHWYGEEYTFTHNQAAVVGELWRAWENGTPDLGEGYLIEESDSQGSRVRDIFKDRNGLHPAWGAMIVSPRKGQFRLASPPKKKMRLFSDSQATPR